MGFSKGWQDYSKGLPEGHLEDQPCQPKEKPILNFHIFSLFSTPTGFARGCFTNPVVTDQLIKSVLLFFIFLYGSTQPTRYEIAQNYMK